MSLNFSDNLPVIILILDSGPNTCGSFPAPPSRGSILPPASSNEYVVDLIISSLCSIVPPAYSGFSFTSLLVSSPDKPTLTVVYIRSF